MNVLDVERSERLERPGMAITRRDALYLFVEAGQAISEFARSQF